MGRIKKLVSKIKKLVDDKSNFSSFLDSHVTKLFDEKKLLEELTKEQKPLQCERTIAIDKLCANNEKNKKDSCDLLQSINDSDGEIADFLFKLEATGEDSPRDSLIDDSKEDQENEESITYEKLEQRNAKLQKDNAMLLHYLKDYESRVDDHKKRLNMFIRDNESVAQLKTSNEELLNQNATLEQSLNTSASKLSALGLNLNQLSKEKDLACAENQNMRDEIENMNCIISSQKSQIEDLMRSAVESERTTSKISQLYEGQISYQSENKGANKEIIQILELTSEEIACCQIRYSSLEKIFTANERDLNNDIIALKQSIRNSLKELVYRKEVSMNQEGTREVADSVESSSKKSRITLANNVLVLENLFVREELCRLEKKHTNLVVGIDLDRQSNTNEIQSQTGNLQDDVSERTKEVEAMTRENRLLKEENASLHKDINILKDLLRDHETKLQSLNNKQSSLQSYNVCLKDTVSKHKGIVARLKEISKREEEIRGRRTVIKPDIMKDDAAEVSKETQSNITEVDVHR